MPELLKAYHEIGKCPKCGVEFSHRDFYFERHDVRYFGYFCSASCVAEFAMKEVEVVETRCMQCGKPWDESELESIEQVKAVEGR
jgi:hypothetical protein